MNWCKRFHLARAAGVASLLVLLGITAWPQKPAPSRASFDSAVGPVLNKSCMPCHDPRTASGGLNIAELTASSLTTRREEWEKVVRRVSAGEMPPAGVPKPVGLTAI